MSADNHECELARGYWAQIARWLMAIPAIGVLIHIVFHLLAHIHGIPCP